MKFSGTPSEGHDRAAWWPRSCGCIGQYSVPMIPRLARRVSVCAASTFLAAASIPLVASSGSAAAVQVFSYTGVATSYTVTAGITQLHVVVRGAAGGGPSGGVGAVVEADLNVQPGDVLQLDIGGAGAAGRGGWNGGGNPGDVGGADVGQNFGGGGASDVRVGSCAATLSCTSADAAIVAGAGGGGDAINAGHGAPVGGAGGIPDATDGGSGHGEGGAGATVSAAGPGGTGATGMSVSGSAGGPGAGGGGGATNGTPSAAACAGSGGGGGWFGGGGGGSDASPCTAGGAGGGGSSHIDATIVSNEVLRLAAVLGDGEITISPSSDAAPEVSAPGVEQVTGTTASFSSVVDSGGASVTARFTYSRSNDFSDATSTALVTVGAGAGPTTVRGSASGLDPASNYFVRTEVTSSAGQVRTTPTEFTTARAPHQPDPPVAVPSTASGSAMVSWIAPSDGGAPVTRYVVHSLPEAGSCTTSSTPPAAAPMMCVVTGLDPQTFYAFVVEAFNDAGGSGQSVAGSPIVPGARSLPVTITKAPWRVLDRRRVAVRVSVGQAATGRVEVSIGSTLLCATSVVNGVAQCRGKVSGRGIRGLRVVFTGAGADTGSSGGTIRRLDVHNVLLTSARSRVSGCTPMLRVAGTAIKGGGVVTLVYKRGTTWRPFAQARSKKSGKWSTTARARFGTLSVRATGAGVSANTLTTTIKWPKRCAR